MKKKCILLIFFVSLTFSCSSEDRLLSNFQKTSVHHEMWQLSDTIKKKGMNGIPIFLKVITNTIDDSDGLMDLNTQSKISICVKSLNELAKNNVYSIDEVPVLIMVLRYVGKSFLAADTLRIITGVDPGISQNYYKSTKFSDTLNKLEVWERWWAENKMGNGSKES